MAVVLTTAGCGVPWPFGAGGAGSGSSGEAEEGSGVGKRVVPVYPPPLTYRMGQPSSYKTVFSDGAIDFAQRPVRFRLEFEVQPTSVTNLTPLVTARTLWRKAGVRPQPFAAGNARGEVGEGRETRPFGAGTYRTYVVTRPKGQAWVILRVYAPQGQAITGEHRATADRLMKSVRIDESRLSGQWPRGPYVAPVVPFSYVRPPGLTGGEKVTEPGWQHLELHYGREKQIRIELNRAVNEKVARSSFNYDRDRFEDDDNKTRDIEDGPEWADEGYRGRMSLWGEDLSDSYHFWSGRWVVDFTSAGREFEKARPTLNTIVHTSRLASG